MASDITVLNRKRGNLKGQLTKLSTFLKEADQADVTEIESKLETVRKIEDNYDVLKLDYYKILEDDELADHEEILSVLEQDIESLKVSFKRISKNFNSNVSELPINKIEVNKQMNVKLPEIPLPQFTGKYENWSLFKTQFDSLITANKNLNDSQKLFYLQAALKNEVKELQTVDDTFDSLMKALEERYENKRLIADIHINAILALEKNNA